jgi:hypothetical protein
MGIQRAVENEARRDGDPVPVLNQAMSDSLSTARGVEAVSR